MAELDVNVNIKAEGLTQALNTVAQAIMMAVGTAHAVTAPEITEAAADPEPKKHKKAAALKTEEPKKEAASEPAKPEEPKKEDTKKEAPEKEAPAPEKSEEERRAEVKKVATAVVRSGKSDAMKKLLTDYGVAKLSAVPLDKLDAFLADVGKL